MTLHTLIKTILGTLNALVSLAYPLIVWLIFTRPSWTKPFAWSLVILGAVRLSLSWRQKTIASKHPLPAWLTQLMSASMIVIGLCVVMAKQTMTFQVYPLVISGAFLVLFGLSLTTRTSMIERFASLYEKDITPEKRTYMRKITWLWCGFFVVNMLVSTTTWLAMSQTAWAWYNGIISYLLMAVLFLGEYGYRHWVFLKRLK